MSRKRGRVELGEYAKMARRVVRAWGQRFAEEGDEPELMELVKLHAEVDAAIGQAVMHLRSRGDDVSWAVIGNALGITRQAARQRWDEGAREKQRAIRARHLARKRGESEAPTLSSTP